MPEGQKPKPSVFQRIAGWFKDAVDWVEETFADPLIATEVREDLGLNTSNPATPTATDPAVRQKIDDFLAKEKVDEAALIATAIQIKALADTIMTFADAVKADGVDATDVFWLIFKVWGADSLRLRNPAGYALCVLAGLILEDDELLPQLDPASITRLLKGEADASDADALIDRLSAFNGALVVILDQLVKPVGGAIDAMYGWDPEPGSDLEASIAASRALSVVFRLGGAIDPILTLIPVTSADGGPGLLLSISAHLKIEHDTGSVVYTTDIGALGAFSLFFRFSTENPDFRVFGPGMPSVDISVNPKVVEGQPVLVWFSARVTRPGWRSAASPTALNWVLTTPASRCMSARANSLFPWVMATASSPHCLAAGSRFRSNSVSSPTPPTVYALTAAQG